MAPQMLSGRELPSAAQSISGPVSIRAKGAMVKLYLNSEQ